MKLSVVIDLGSNRAPSEVRRARSGQAVYARQLQKTGVAGLVVNQLGGRDGQDATAGFGGALAVAADGTLLAAWPPHTEGLLLVDVPAGTPSGGPG
jgi:hypothetical protein